MVKIQSFYTMNERNVSILWNKDFRILMKNDILSKI